MAMFPNATRGYMPFVSGQGSGKKNVPAKKSSKTDKRKTKGKTYQVTLRDKSGNTYSYIVKTDGTNSMPVLCSQAVNGIKSTDSLPNIGIDTRKILSSVNLPQDCKEDGGAKKEGGLFSSLVRFLKQKTGKSKSGKSKRKVKTLVMRKRQRTISAMSNLDPIQECPDEDEYYDYDDTDSYTHDSSDSGSETSENLSIGGLESKQDETEFKKES